jgi:large subunit ribosomal protein L31e
MAKKEEAPKIVLERIYVIPLRQATLKSPFYKKAKKAMSAVKIFIAKHMKSKDIKIGRYLNLEIWKHGIKNPPNKIKVVASKDSNGKVMVEMEGAPKEEPKIEPKKPAKKDEKIVKDAEFKEKPETKAEKKPESAKEEKAEESKIIEKEEIKELKKEHPKQHAPKAPSQPKFQQQRPSAPKSV